MPQPPYSLAPWRPLDDAAELDVVLNRIVNMPVLVTQFTWLSFPNPQSLTIVEGNLIQVLTNRDRNTIEAQILDSSDKVHSVPLALIARGHKYSTSKPDDPIQAIGFVGDWDGQSCLTVVAPLRSTPPPSSE